MKQLCLYQSEHVSHTDAHDVDDILWVFVFTAETERHGTDHLDLAGLPQRSTNSDSTHTLPTTPESRKKSKGIMKLFGKWVENDLILIYIGRWVTFWLNIDIYISWNNDCLNVKF